MFALDEKTVGAISSILNDTNYKKNIDYLREVFVATRSQGNRYNASFLLSAQLTLANFQSDVWKMLREGRRLKKEIKDKNYPTKTEELQGIEYQIVINKQLLRISKVIADGMAWRNMSYDRMLMDIASRAFGTGAIDAEASDFQSELAWAFIISKKFNATVFVNDLTNYLRIGDLTEIRGEEIFVHEIKKLGEKVNNVFTLNDKKKLTKQSKRLLEFQEVAKTKVIDFNGKKVSSVTINVRLQNHFRKIVGLLENARRNGTAEIKIEPYLTVHATSFHDSSKLDFTKGILNIPTAEKGFTVVHSNWDSFYSDGLGNFMRLMLPYSISPFKNSYCMDLMSGHLLLTTALNIEGLKQAFKNKGWEIEEFDEKELDKDLAEMEKNKETIFSGEKLITTSTYSSSYYFMLRRGPFAFPIDTKISINMTYEFLTFETINQFAENAYSRAEKKQKDEIYYPIFADDKKIWN